MEKVTIKIGYAPTRRDVFSKEEAHKFREIVLEKIKEFDAELVDIDDINEEGLLFDDRDVDKVVEKFQRAGVDGIFFPHCNFGSEHCVSKVASAVGKPVLIWGPRDDAPLANGDRSRDTQCGLFATGKVLRRFNVPYTYIVNTTVDDKIFAKGYDDFISVCQVVKAMKRLRILQIATRPDAFWTMICNEGELLEKFGIQVFPVTMSDLVLKVEEIKKNTDSPEFKETYDSAVSLIDFSKLTDEEKVNIVAIKLAMKSLCLDNGCKAVAIQCWTVLQDMLHVMPCLANGLLTEEGIPTVCETDIHGAISSIILQEASRRKTPIFFADLTIRHPENDNAELAMLAAGGALHHLGIEHFRAAGDFTDPEVLGKIVQFGRCARVVSGLNGQKYGLIGGRSLGMYSSTVSMQDWERIFGVDVDHMDQSEIVRKAAEVDDAQVEKAFRWLTDNMGAIEYDGNRLTEEKLKEQIRHYEATKAIVKENNYDFIGVKCHYEMSRHYCTECLSAAFMNDPYDWDGEKEPVVCACEADSDAALTMQILKLLTNDPVIFMDVRHYDAENDVMVFCNCGSQSTYYATGTNDYKANLAKTTLYPCLEIYAGGGCHVNLQTKPGHATIARLNRYEGRYRMTIIPTDFVELPKEKEAETTMEWPHVFARLPFDHHIFLDKFDANHCHAVYGDHVEELKMICEMLDIDVEILGE